jgi:VanZ family protein
MVTDSRGGLCNLMMNRLLFYWLPPVAWAIVILSSSTEHFSSSHTAGWLEMFAGFLKYSFSPATLTALNLLVRKSAHLIHYGILGALSFRAVRGDRPGWRMRWALQAIAIAAFVASIDEIHQTFVPSRTGTWHDVVIDTAGAAGAQILIRAVQVLLFRPS